MKEVPTADQRAKLDEYIKILTRLGDGLSIDDFRPEAIVIAQRTKARVKTFVTWGSVLFLVLMIVELAVPLVLATFFPKTSVSSLRGLQIVLWSFALGGLGAIANTFLHLLKLVPVQTLNTSDFSEVVGRVMLGCLFSTVLSLTLFPQIGTFLESLYAPKPDPGSSGAIALVPFLLGYSIPLVLRLLDKTLQAIELTVGAEDRRTTTTNVRAPRTPRVAGKRGL
jgi:hypothetical protein